MERVCLCVCSCNREARVTVSVPAAGATAVADEEGAGWAAGEAHDTCNQNAHQASCQNDVTCGKTWHAACPQLHRTPPYAPSASCLSTAPQEQAPSPANLQLQEMASIQAQTPLPATHRRQRHGPPKPHMSCSALRKLHVCLWLSCRLCNTHVTPSFTPPWQGH